MSANLRIELDGGRKVVEVPRGISAADALRGAGNLASDTVAACVNGVVVDLSRPVEADATVEPIRLAEARGLEILRHSAAHVLAEATKRVLGEARLEDGPPVENGFYYDMDLPRALKPEDLSKIEEEMRAIVRADLPFVRREVPREDAIRLMESRGETIKVLMLRRKIVDPIVSLYETGSFVDLCRGPHVPSTAWIRAFRVTHVSGAYLGGDERNQQLQRVYGTAWASETDLEAYLHRVEEAKKRDHRRLGIDLDLFSVQDDAGSGLVFWHPKGGRVRMAVESFWREEHLRRGYEFVYTPHIAKAELWKTSGHLEFYKDSMYEPMDVEGQPYLVKPMNCPGHILIYKSRLRSYRDLPLRLAELGTVYRYERSGTLAGLLRVRGFTQDDAHIFCAEDQLRSEIEGVLELVDVMMRAFGYEYRCRLSTMPTQHSGTVEQWRRVEAILAEAMRARGLSFEIDAGGGAFYAPKIDVQMRDALGRDWQGPTVQVDFNLPERFDLTYVARDGAKTRVYMVHRAVLGSLERFFATLIEHTGGAFPLWLAPVQVRILTVSEATESYAADVETRLRAEGFRVETDLGSEKIGAKIRNGLSEKIPYLAVLGAREAQGGTVAVRERKQGDLGSTTLDSFVLVLRERLRART